MPLFQFGVSPANKFQGAMLLRGLLMDLSCEISLSKVSTLALYGRLEFSRFSNSFFVDCFSLSMLSNIDRLLSSIKRKVKRRRRRRRRGKREKKPREKKGKKRGRKRKKRKRKEEKRRKGKRKRE